MDDMDEFKIEDDFDENSAEQEEKRKTKSIIIIVAISLIVGLIVFFICYALFGPKTIEPEPLKETPLNLDEENVEILYDYVTYGINGTRNDKFVKEKKVTLSSFSNQEKFYYALQFAQPEDFVSTGELDENKNKIYYLSDEYVGGYMERFFGNHVTYSNDVTLEYPFTFRINNKNVGTLTPTKNGDGFNVIFDSLKEPKEKEIVEPVYGDLSAAYKEVDGTYRLEEKVIYTRYEKSGDAYTIYIYKDYAKTDLIETKMGQTKEMLAANPINVKNYGDKAVTIKYHFALYNNMLYFDSSEIVEEASTPTAAQVTQ